MTPEQSLTVQHIVVKLAQLGHEVSWAEPVTEGPLVTTYRFQPKAASKVAAICGLSQDLAIALGAEDVIVQRLPGEHYIGITVPNKQRRVVLWRDTLGSTDRLVADAFAIPINFGVDSQGRLFRDDLTKMPHLLIAGSTDSGKSTFVRSLIASLIYWCPARDIQFVLSDTKGVEFPDFLGAPHLRCDPVTTMFQTLERLDELHDEVEQRLKRLASLGLQNILQLRQASWYKDPGTTHRMPYIVVVIDELADLFPEDDRAQCRVSSAKLGRLVQKSRAVGIHVIAATQRSSVNVVSGPIKTNFPARLSFRLPSEVDSRTILGRGGAEHLLSRGDMLFLSPSRPAPIRLHSGIADVRDIRAAVEASAMHQRAAR